jgi:protein-S-isoprenylcysteine O-methyltransferase Ste14
MNKKRRLPPTYFISALLACVIINLLYSGKVLIPYPYNLTGILPIVLGIMLNLLADQAFKKVNTTVKPFEESRVLVQDGVFRLTRHPMYLGMILIILGTVIILGSLIPFFIIPICVIVMEIVFIRIEEKMLEEQFGEQWLDYQKKVRRWI